VSLFKRQAAAGVAAIEQKVEALGDSNVSKQLDYILQQRTSEKTFHNGVCHKGHAGKRLRDFLEHPQSVMAGLKEQEVGALRVYTTSAFQQIIEQPLTRSGTHQTAHIYIYIY
jgi:hypothetical protein